MNMRLSRADWEFTVPFRIAYRARTHAETVTVELQEGDFIGRGEALGVSYRGESVEIVLDQLADLAEDVRNGMSRHDLQKLLPAGGARNALDCAFWDLQAKRSGRRVWELAELQSVRPLQTAFTLGLDAPAAMGGTAARNPQYPILKMKLDGHRDMERVASVRNVRPDAQLVLDANQSWTNEQLREWTPQLAQLAVELIEQPLSCDQDDVLATFTTSVPLCADESCQTIDSLAGLQGKYQYINIKLDKTGGLTAALDLARQARERGFKLMVGCMGGSSLSMAPAFILGQLCDRVDLDGPLLTRADVPHGIEYQGSWMFAPQASLWG